ncbi:MAG: signal peptide peptidase SppA [Planctomycetes bacterium]|nr:signal peptide peptidase SppA [Planctomycetota bacterium]
MSSTPPGTPPPPDDSQQPRRHLNPPPPLPPSRPVTAGTTLVQSCLIAGCVTVIVPFLLVGGFFLVFAFLFSSQISEGLDGGWGAVSQGATTPNLRERVLRRGAPDAPTIAIVAIQGVIEGSGSTLHGEGMMDFVAAQLRAARENDKVAAVILQIDSPGGGLTASDLLHHEVKRLRETGKPVLAWSGSSLTSGAYYIAGAADEIMANPTTTIGSIGVVMQHFQAEELLAKLGIRVDPITSVVHKDIGSPFREMTEEERRILQDYIDAAHSRFVAIVAEGRTMPEERVRELADGSIVTPVVALDQGLIDSIGYFDDAIAWVESATGSENMRIVGYKRVISLSDIFGEAGASAARGAVETARQADTAPRIRAVP